MSTTPKPREPMHCPQCGAIMHCHAEKPVEPRTRVEAEQAARGPLVDEIHHCRECGDTETRRVST